MKYILQSAFDQRRMDRFQLVFNATFHRNVFFIMFQSSPFICLGGFCTSQTNERTFILGVGEGLDPIRCAIDSKKKKKEKEKKENKARPSMSRTVMLAESNLLENVASLCPNSNAVGARMRTRLINCRSIVLLKARLKALATVRHSYTGCLLLSMQKKKEKIRNLILAQFEIFSLFILNERWTFSVPACARQTTLLGRLWRRMRMFVGHLRMHVSWMPLWLVKDFLWSISGHLSHIYPIFNHTPRLSFWGGGSKVPYESSFFSLRCVNCWDNL